MIRKVTFTILFIVLTLVLGLSGCITVNPSSVSQPTTSVPQPIPQLTELEFTLAVQPQQEHAWHAFPIYIRSKQTLHLHWQVIRGCSFWMLCVTPREVDIGVRSDGHFNLESQCSELVGTGSLIFSPSESIYVEGVDRLGEGYYLFQPHIYKTHSPVTVKVQYWIED